MKTIYAVLCLTSDAGKLLYHIPQKTLKAAREFVAVMREAEPSRNYFITVCQRGDFEE